MTVRFEGRVTPADEAAAPYLELPFEVPEGAEAIEVTYRHDAGSVLDLGLFEPGLGPFPSERGFRGWSGGARDRVFVARGSATPGYLAGPLPSGTWRVVLGLASVAEGGCDYRIDVAVGFAPGVAPVAPEAEPAPGAAAKRPPAGRSGRGWYRGDLQSHTHHSDAKGSLRDLEVAALARGLDFVAVTDHNTVSHHQPLEAMGSRELLWIPGTEVTTYRGHANVWGVSGWVDFRARDDADVETLVRHVHERGGLFSVNHPKESPGCIGCDWTYRVPPGVDCLEAWQGPWPLRNWESLARYDDLLRAGRRITLIGGSDRHQPPQPDGDPEHLQIGSPTTYLYLEERTQEAVLEALRRGRATVSEGPAGPFLAIEVDGTAMGATAGPTGRAVATVRGALGESLRWVAAAGALREVPIDADPFEDAFTPDPPGPFLRAEVVARGSLAQRRSALEAAEREGGLPAALSAAAVLAHPFRMALSNPVYFRTPAQPFTPPDVRPPTR